MNLNGSVTVVTGAASGIGRALARRFATEGAAAVIAADIDGAGAALVADEIGGRAFELDTTDEPAVVDLIESVEAEQGPIELWCGNAGIGGPGGVEAPTEEAPEGPPGATPPGSAPGTDGNAARAVREAEDAWLRLLSTGLTPDTRWREAEALLQAAQLAREGLTGGREILEHPQKGFWASFTYVPLPHMLTGLGRSWVTDTLTYKRYPGCAYIDTTMDALFEVLASFELVTRK